MELLSFLHNILVGGTLKQRVEEHAPRVRAGGRGRQGY
jgi:hypothetical protein